MKDEDKTKKQLINQLIKMRQRFAELRKIETKSKHIKEVLKASEKKHRFLYKNSPAINIIVGIDGLIKDINKSVVVNLGYSRDEAIGKYVLDFVVPEQRENVTTQLERAFKGKYTPAIDVDVYAKDGSIHTILFSPGQLLMFEGKQPNSVLFTAIDITRRLSSEHVGKQAEAQRAATLEALGESEQLFQTVFDTTQDSIFIKDLTLKYIQVNPAMEKLFGLPASKLIGQTDENLFGEEAGAYVREIDSRVISGESIEDVHTKPVEGIPKTFHVIKVPIRDKTGKITGLCGIARDITERKWVEEELIESEQRYRDIVEKSGIAISLDDEKGDIKYANKKFAELFGYSSKEIRAKSIKTVVHPDDVERVMKFHNQRIHGEQAPSRYELRGIRKDGSTLYLETDVVEVRKGEKIVGTRSYIWDITERKRIEGELKKAQEYSRNLIDSSLDMIISVNQERRIVEFNRAAQETFGYTKDEVLGKHIDILYADPEEGLKAHNTTRKIGRFSAEIMNRRRNGELFPTFLSASVLQDENGEFLGVMGVSRDISEFKWSEKEKENLQTQLLQAQKMEAVGQLSGGVAHDFNNLLTVILGYSHLTLRHIDEDTPIHKNIEKIAKAGKQAATLTRQLLAFSRKQVLQPKVLNLNKVLTDVQKMLQRLIGEDIKLEADLDPNLKNVKVDPGQIEQVVMNLVVNARDAMPDGGKITIRTENVDIDKDLLKVIPEALPGRFVRFSVEDTGVGIDKAILNQIFEPFFTTKEIGVGTGFGLSVVYGIIKQHDGWINVYSEPGQGSTFKVYLPAIPVMIEDEKEDEISLKDLHGNGERILLVEDEAGIREFAAEDLRENGYVVLEAESSKDALDIFKSEDGNFDLVFSDVVLPDKNGLQLVDELLSVRPELRVLLCSGYLDTKSQWREIRKRGFRFLQKPYAVTDLLQTVKEVK